MQSKKSLKKSLLLVSIGGIAFFSVVFFSALTDGRSVEPVSVAMIAAPEQGRSALPVRLKIPKISVDAPIEYVGLTSEGAVDVPKDPASAAWFDQSPRPGEKGSAVIDGHFGWKDSIAAVFDDLIKLEKGDKIHVEDENGTTTVFTVSKVMSYGENEPAPEVFNSSDGLAHLNLVTCEGLWNKARKSYSNRFVVFADKDGE